MTQVMLPPAESPPTAILRASTPCALGIVEEPAHEVLDLIDLHRELRLRGELIVDGVGDDAGALGDEAHGYLELVERPVREAAAMDIDQRSRGNTCRLGRRAFFRTARVPCGPGSSRVSTAPIVGHGPSPSIV